ncbi:MAG: hypothetical protein ABI262_20430 [Microcoleus sp.]
MCSFDCALRKEEGRRKKEEERRKKKEGRSKTTLSDCFLHFS